MEGRQLKHKFRTTWRNMVYRCTNPNDRRYYYYSKIGIDPAWLVFENFKSDMFDSFIEHVGEHGLSETTIERINNEAPYFLQNCKWATWKEQRENSSHPLASLIKKICKDCQKVFEEKAYKKSLFCSKECRTNYRRVPYTERHERRKARIRKTYAERPDVRKRQRIASEKWLEKRINTDPEYAKVLEKRQSGYAIKWRKKKLKNDPIWAAEQRRKKTEQARERYRNDEQFRAKEIERNKAYRNKKLTK